MTAYAEVYEGRDGWRWRLVAGNGEIVAQGEAHTRKENAQRALDTVKDAMAEADPRVPRTVVEPKQPESLDAARGGGRPAP